jgi:hypothetical protein
MNSAIRIKQKIHNDRLVIAIPELKKLIGKEIEILLLIEEDGEDTTPPKGLQNSPHVAGSIILDQEAMDGILGSRYK